MNIEYITCSDMREHNDIDEIIDLGKKYPCAEFAIQAHPSKFSPSMPRYVWFDTLVHALRVNKIKIAMHVNSEYRTEVCSYGVVPYHLRRLWEIRRIDGTPVIGRVQININGGNDIFEFHADKVADIIRAYPDIKFIFQYTSAQHGRISKLDKKHVPFALLYDASGGCGISPDSWYGPVFPNHQMGYSGGLSPENVVDNLNEINEILPADYSTWIDAEGKLKSPDSNGKKVFDVALAEKYIERAYRWQILNGYQR
ncbi:MAG: hypothetical protein J5714_00735 [Alphaproteobacteria bacterium]|nr:hypothetical protein [Alphaproteobacteria bacterium]